MRARAHQLAVGGVGRRVEVAAVRGDRVVDVAEALGHVADAVQRGRGRAGARTRRDSRRARARIAARLGRVRERERIGRIDGDRRVDGAQLRRATPERDRDRGDHAGHRDRAADPRRPAPPWPLRRRAIGERVGERERVGIARLGIAGERGGDDGREAARDAGERRRAGELLRRDVIERARVERRVAGEHRVQRDADCVEIRARIDREPEDLLRRHERRRADRLPGLRQPIAAAREPADAEVGQLDDVARREHHVRRLDVAMHDAGRMDRVHAAQDLQRDRDRALGREWAVAQHHPQIAAIDVLHHEVVRVIAAAARVVDPDDVRVDDLARDARLAAKPRDRIRVRRVCDDLDRHGAMQLRIVGEVDRAHAAAPEQLRDDVAIAERLADPLRHAVTSW